MTVQPYDECVYHDEVCEVEQVWEDEQHVCYCALRPYSHPDGMYLVRQDDVGPVPWRVA